MDAGVRDYAAVTTYSKLDSCKYTVCFGCFKIRNATFFRSLWNIIECNNHNIHTIKIICCICRLKMYTFTVYNTQYKFVGSKIFLKTESSCSMKNVFLNKEAVTKNERWKRMYYSTDSVISNRTCLRCWLVCGLVSRSLDTVVQFCISLNIHAHLYLPKLSQYSLLQRHVSSSLELQRCVNVSFLHGPP